MAEEKQFCPECGKEVKTDEAFCGECGAKLKTEVNTTSTNYQTSNSFAVSFFRGCGTFFSLVSYFILSTVISFCMVLLVEPKLADAVRVSNVDTILEQIYYAIQNSSAVFGICLAVLAGLVITLAICTLTRLNTIENKLEDIQRIVQNQNKE